MHAPSAISCASMGRRKLIVGGIGLAGLIITGGAGPILARPQFSTYPFTLGVASGDPQPDGFVIWTRLAPQPVHGGGMLNSAVPVEWMVAEDDKFRRVVRSGVAIAVPDWAHSVHAEVDGLRPDRWYYYRFRCGGELSPIGRSRSAPAPHAQVRRLRLAVASCQHYEQGYFSAYRHMLDDDLDMIVHVGDYIYEGSWGKRLRPHESDSVAVTLEQYRNRHACYKLDPDLQRAHAVYPWLLTWDDHEVENDYAGNASGSNETAAEFLRRRAAAYQAYYEHMPLRRSSLPADMAMRIYGSLRFGNLAEIHLIDDRQYRSGHACSKQGKNQGAMTSDCAQRYASEQSMLGETQEKWLLGGLGASTARWQVIAQQTLMAPFESRQEDGSYAVWTDGWDGYAGARARLLDFIAQRDKRNVVVLGGDMHAFYATDLKSNFADERAPVIATEFVGSSITSHDVDYESVARDLPHNPHVRFFDSRWRGYIRCAITPEAWRSDFQMVEDVGDSASSGRTLASFTVENGRPGAMA